MAAGPAWRAPAARMGVRSLFVSAESTPNPDSLKFCPADVVVLEEDQGTGVVSTWPPCWRACWPGPPRA